ncbi:hypothetical protein FACS1894187_10500 [Synergistales bacterium]|nr:hypothetical protein FACS1894187_10500 [Synergistales bacterium]
MMPDTIRIDLLPEVRETLREILDYVKRLDEKFENRKANNLSEWLTMKAMVESTKSSPSSVNRRVHDGTIEVSYHMGPKSPRYRFKKTAMEGARV